MTLLHCLICYRNLSLYLSAMTSLSHMCTGSLSFKHPLISCVYTVSFLKAAEFPQNVIAFLLIPIHTHRSLFSLRNPGKIFPFSILAILIISSMESHYFEDPRWAQCYVMQAVVSVSCLGDKCLLHAKPNEHCTYTTAHLQVLLPTYK